VGEDLLRFTGWITNSAAFIQVFVFDEKNNILGDIPLCIDTGACSTCLFERDAVNLGIDYSKLKRARPAIGIGGRADAYELKNVKLGLIDGDDRGYLASFDSMMVIVPQKNLKGKIVGLIHHLLGSKGSSYAQSSRGLPSLLGFDFLRTCKISFSNNEVYLDREIA
jgi:hypothetical protein